MIYEAQMKGCHAAIDPLVKGLPLRLGVEAIRSQRLTDLGEK